jgi:cellulose synthase/poly-beta-1,6-N-acetylglucosamine synthase-like glycosyltransferase
MESIFYIFVGAELLLGLWSLIQGFQWLAIARRRARRHSGFFAPRVALLCPCKGAEPGLEENLSSLTGQDYPNFEVFFVLARADDSAGSILKRVATASPVLSHTLIAGQPKACGEKVNNLRFAVDQLEPVFEVFVFADSDGRPGRQWLTHLVAPLNDPRLGAATTFRWWLPMRGGFWSAFGAAWDASIVTMLGEHDRNFCWGGGTAIRRTIFDEAKVRDHWDGAISDDWGITRALQSAGRKIQFIPECLVPTLRDADAKSLLNFTNRQIIITRVYAPKVWLAGASSHLLYCASLILGAAAIIQAISIGQLWLTFALLVVLIMLLAAIKGILRWLAVIELLPTYKIKLQTYAWAWTVLAPLVPFLYAINFAVSAFSRRIKWRGIRYNLRSASQTDIV